jgi:hypothetical protein
MSIGLEWGPKPLIDTQKNLCISRDSCAFTALCIGLLELGFRPIVSRSRADLNCLARGDLSKTKICPP